MPMPLIDISDQKFGRLTVLRRDPSDSRKWICRCDCGTERPFASGRLRAGRSQSCGCLRVESTIRKNKDTAKHGKSTTKAYGVWRAMIQRCTDVNCRSYKNYGGRGITVCARWFTFENFYEDMGDPPEGLEIDRENNDGNYEPGNCRWVTRKVNSMNRRPRSIKERV
jgi:hypothetical protein